MQAKEQGLVRAIGVDGMVQADLCYLADHVAGSSGELSWAAIVRWAAADDSTCPAHVLLQALTSPDMEFPTTPLSPESKRLLNHSPTRRQLQRKQRHAYQEMKHRDLRQQGPCRHSWAAVGGGLVPIVK